MKNGTTTFENSFVHCFSYSDKKIHMHIWAVKYKLCNFSDSTKELSGLIFAFKTVIAQYKDERKIIQNLHFFILNDVK